MKNNKKDKCVIGGYCLVKNDGNDIYTDEALHTMTVDLKNKNTPVHKDGMIIGWINDIENNDHGISVKGSIDISIWNKNE